MGAPPFRPRRGFHDLETATCVQPRAGALLAQLGAPTLHAELAAAAAAVTSAEAARNEHRLRLADVHRQPAHERERVAARVSSQHQYERAELTLAQAKASERRAAAQLAKRKVHELELEAQRGRGWIRCSRQIRAKLERVETCPKVHNIACAAVQGVFRTSVSHWRSAVRAGSTPGGGGAARRQDRSRERGRVVGRPLPGFR